MTCWQDDVCGKFQCPEKWKETEGAGRAQEEDKLGSIYQTSWSSQILLSGKVEDVTNIGETEVVRMNVVYHGLDIDEQVLRKVGTFSALSKAEYDRISARFDRGISLSDECQ